MLTRIYGLYKDGNDDPICETAKEAGGQSIGLSASASVLSMNIQD